MGAALSRGLAQVSALLPFGQYLQAGGHGSNEENMSNVRLLLVERMDPDFGLLDKLLQLCALTYPETVLIKGKTSIIERNDKLLELIFNKMKHQALLTSLTETGQKHLFNLVTGNGGYRAEYGTVWPLGERKTQILDVNRINLVDNICPCELMTRMFSRRVINDRQQQFINSLSTYAEKSGALLDILRRGSEEYYYTTITCLQESKQGHVAELLLNGGVLTQVHVSNEGETEKVNEEEDHVLEAFKALLQNTTSPQWRRMKELLDVQIMGATKGQSIVFYIYCKNLVELLYLYELLTKGEFKRCIAAVFDLLISKRETTVSAVNWSEDEFTRFKTYFEGKHLHDEKAVKQQQQSPDPPKQREAVEGTRGDEDVVSQFKSLKVGGRDKVETDVSKMKLRGMATEENWEEIIRTNYTQLMKIIETDFGLFGELQKARIFTPTELKSFLGYTDTRNKIDWILKNLLKKDFESFKKFCEALNHSGQEHVVREYLSKVQDVSYRQDTTTDSPLKEDSPHYRPISDGMWECLKQHWNDLIAEITFDEGLLAQVERRKIFTALQIYKLKDIQSEAKRTEQVLGWLKYGSEKQFLDFCEALKDNNQLHLVKQYLTPKIPDIDRDPEGMATEDNWQDILRMNYTQLLKNIITETGLYGELQKARIFTPTELKSFMDCKDTKDQIDQMLENVLKKDFKSFQNFCEALNHSGQEHIVRKYLSKGY